MPDIGLIGSDGKLVSLHHQKFAGQPVIVFVYSLPAKSACLRELDRFAEMHERFVAAGAIVIAVNAAPAQANAALMQSRRLPFPVLGDPSGTILQSFGLRADRKPAWSVVVLDANQRAVRRIVPSGEVRLAVPALKICEELRSNIASGAVVTQQAPVLLIPNVLEPALCRDLITAWEDGERIEGGVSKSSASANLNVDYGYKRRQDVLLREGVLLEAVLDRTRQRIWSEMRKVYQYSPTHFEMFRIGCYTAEDQGFFAAHRDNRTPLTKHRRFAVTVCLNDAYEGGFLRFREYGGRPYKPEAGGAIVFSCDLLHEVVPVSSGRRFVLVSFFYGAAEAAEVAARFRSAG